jgi:DNA-binding NarL/FixJ family response regulator
MSKSHRFTSTNSSNHTNTNFINHGYCPLTPALRQLIDASVYLGTTNNKVLAEHLICSEETVKSGFRRISVMLNTHSRTETLLKALTHGWVNSTYAQ